MTSDEILHGSGFNDIDELCHEIKPLFVGNGYLSKEDIHYSFLTTAEVLAEMDYNTFDLRMLRKLLTGFVHAYCLYRVSKRVFMDSLTGEFIHYIPELDGYGDMAKAYHKIEELKQDVAKYVYN